MLKLSPTLRVLDLDGSVTRQRRLLATMTDHQVLTLRDLGPSIRYLATRRSMKRLEAALHRNHRDRLTMIGSGDFHHVTASLLRAFQEPLSLVVFDTHPDWDRTSPWPCCGSWVLEALRMPHVEKIVMIGLGRGDIEGWRINVGRVRHLADNRVSFYPYDCPVSRAIGRYSSSSGSVTLLPKRLSTEIRWKTVADRTWDVVMDEVIRSLPTQQIYVSVDKDCLRGSDANTNWETGGMSRAQLLKGLEMLATHRDIVGADITGEYSEIKIQNPLFRALSRWDHPKPTSPVTDSDLSLNETLNLELLSALGFAQHTGLLQ